MSINQDSGDYFDSLIQIRKTLISFFIQLFLYSYRCFFLSYASLKVFPFSVSVLKAPSLTLWENVYIYGVVNDPSVFNDKNIYIVTDLTYFEFGFGE